MAIFQYVSYCVFFRFRIMLLMFAVFSGSSWGNAENNAFLPEIMTLDETADFLRMPAQELQKMANKQTIPGRRMGERWRFSRSVLLLWMSGQSPEDLLERYERKKETKIALSKSELSNISGMGGNATVADKNNEVETQQDPEVIGTKPDYQSAENVFLRDQAVLLKSGQTTLELDLLYSRNERQGLVSIIPGGIGSVELQTDSKQDVYTANLNLRYGVLDNIQFFAGIPFVSRSQKVTVATQEISDTTNSEWGDITLGLRYAALAEGWGYPSIILSAEGLVPTKDSPYSVGGSIALTKSIDPAVLFANFGYRYWVNDGINEISKVQPDNQYNLSLGVAYALNDTLTLSTSISGLFSSRTEFNQNTVRLNSEHYSLQFGLTSMIYKNFFLEPFVTFGLNGQDSDVTFGLKIPYTFD